MSTAPISGERVFSRPVMARVAYVASSIPRLICMEVVEALRPALRHRSRVTVVRIKAVVNMAIKAVRAMKPGTSSKKHAANKPIRTIIAVRSTVIWGIVEIPVRAHGCRSDVYADGHLGSPHRYTAQQASHKSCESKRVDFEHGFSLNGRQFQPGQQSASIILKDQDRQVGLSRRYSLRIGDSGQ
jgi:hypothetical protein